MNVKAYLQQAYRIEMLVRSRTEQIQRLESLAVSVGHPLDSSGGGFTQRDPTKGSKVESLAIQLVELRERVSEESAKLLKLRQEITSKIHAVNNLTYEYLLEERYLNYKSFDSIADDMGLSKDYVFRLHREALKLIKVS